MALTKEQWDRIGEIREELTAMGCAVAIFTPDDVEGMAESQAEADEAEEEEGGSDAPVMTAEDSAAWIAEHRKHLEDAMSTTGNLYIADNVDAVGIPT